jgi:hypothetical protein
VRYGCDHEDGSPALSPVNFMATINEQFVEDGAGCGANREQEEMMNGQAAWLVSSTARIVDCYGFVPSRILW